MKTHRSRWIMKAAAAAALVGGLGGVAGATTLVAGGFPGADFYNQGSAQCVVTNLGIRDVQVTATMYDGPFGTVLDQESGWVVHPGQTRASVSVPFDNSGRPCGCTFDVSTRTGVRAAFVYANGTTTTVVPATK
jgi:hypothetical protein